MIRMFDDYLLDVSEKVLYLFDKIVASGEAALDWAYELAPFTEWMVIDEKPPLVAMRWEHEEYCSEV